MTDQETQKLIDELTARVAKLENRTDVPDHQHLGFDASRIRIQNLDSVFFKQAVINPANLAAGTGETDTITNVSGASLGDFVLVAPPYDTQGLTVTGWVSAAGTVKIRIQNGTAGAVDLASGTWRVLVLRKIV